MLFAPGLRSLDDIKQVCAAVTKPVNFMGGFAGMTFTLAELADAGVRRVSLAAALYPAALTGVDAAAREIRDNGTFTFASKILTSADVTPMLR